MKSIKRFLSNFYLIYMNYGLIFIEFELEIQLEGFSDPLNETNLFIPFFVQAINFK